VRPDILAGRWRPPVSDGSGRDRVLARAALAELSRAGYTLKDGALRDSHGAPFGFEILVKTRPEERLALDYAAMLARIGVKAQVRLVDETQFQRRRQRFDFDMIPAGFPASASPGAEERGRWGSAAASQEGAFNVAGVRSPAVDAMISALLAATSEEDFIAAVRALDRLLLSGFYMVPFYHAKSLWIAYSARLGHPARIPLYGVDLDAWWMKPR
jgi:peptide/nickel transport system substrate-binding protein